MSLSTGGLPEKLLPPELLPDGPISGLMLASDWLGGRDPREAIDISLN